MILINSSVAGIDSHGVSILDDLNVSKKNDIFFVCNKDAKDFPNNVYTFLRDCLVKGKRVYLIGIGDVDHKLYSNLLVTYKAYDIYNLRDENALTRRYLLELQSRQCSIDDVAQFVGCEAISYGELDTLLLDLYDRIDELGLDDIGEDTLEGAAEVVNYLKFIDAEYNYRELMGIVDGLKEELQELGKSKVLLESDLVTSKETVENLNERLKRARDRVNELESAPKIDTSSTSSRGMLVKQPTCLTDKLMTETKHILYIKEISRIPYINTLIMYLADYIRTMKLAGKKAVCKLVIFDFNSIGDAYKPIPTLTSDEYMNRRSEMAGTRMELCMATPQLSVLKDILTGEFSGIEASPNVLIVYDRTGQTTDIVAGERVTKFFVGHSKSLLQAVAQEHRISDISRVITTADTYIGDKQLDIPRIEGYKGFESASRKQMAYLGLDTRYGQENLMKGILERAGVTETLK